MAYRALPEIFQFKEVNRQV